jgi:hypothetical protein
MDLTSWKHLEVVSPRLANNLGVKAEAPVLVSPDVSKRTWCKFCKSYYAPLIYGYGEITAHHFHPEHQRGGIYHYHKERLYPGVIALLDCFNCTISSSFFNTYIAPSVVINAVLVACTKCSSITDDVYFIEYSSGIMKPFCEYCFHNLEGVIGRASFKAIVRDGVLLFHY